VKGEKMQANGKQFVQVVLFLVVLAACGLFYGCQSTQTTKVDEAAAQAAYQSPEQTECPVTGGPINKDIYTVYQGKKVYFCCEGCKRTFEKNPQKYIGKLPQFAK
jgi:YHS domain-containing protein